MNRRKRQAVCSAVVNTVTVIIITIIIVKSRKIQQRNIVAQPTEYVHGVDNVTFSIFKITKTTRKTVSTKSQKILKFTSPIVEIYSTIELELNTTQMSNCTY